MQSALLNFSTYIAFVARQKNEMLCKFTSLIFIPLPKELRSCSDKTSLSLSPTIYNSST